jgi:hypothetical protein
MDQVCVRARACVHLQTSSFHTRISISAGYRHTCGLRTGSYITCFGDGGSELVTGDGRKVAPMPPDWERFSKVTCVLWRVTCDV